MKYANYQIYLQCTTEAGRLNLILQVDIEGLSGLLLYHHGGRYFFFSLCLASFMFAGQHRNAQVIQGRVLSMALRVDIKRLLPASGSYRWNHEGH